MKKLSRPSTGSAPARCLTFALALTVATSVGAESFELHSGVLIAPENGSVYVMAPSGGIDAVEVSTGNVVWRTQEAAKPLLIEGTTLIAQSEPTTAGELAVAVFDTRGAGVPTRSARVDLPAHVQGQISQSLRSSFQAQAAMVNQKVEFAWKSETRPVKGISPLAREELSGPAIGNKSVTTSAPRQTSRIDQGAALLDLANGRVEKAQPRKAAAPNHGLKFIELTAEERLSGVAGRQFLSADGSHVLASARAQDVSRQTRHDWTLFERASGKPVGQAVLPVSARPFLVQGDTLVLVTPPRTYQVGDDDWAVESFTLRGIDLVTGNERWTKEVRDAEYRGPAPH